MSKVTLTQLGLGSADLTAIGKLSEKGMSPDEIADGIEKIKNVQSSASEIDNMVINGATQADLNTLTLESGNMTPEQALSIEVLNKQLLDGSQNGDFTDFQFTNTSSFNWYANISTRVKKATDPNIIEAGIENWIELPVGDSTKQALVYLPYGTNIYNKYFQSRFYIYSENGEWNIANVCYSASGVSSGATVAKKLSESFIQISNNVRLYTVNSKITQATAITVLFGAVLTATATQTNKYAFAGYCGVLKDIETTTPIIPARLSLLDKTRKLTLNNSSNWSGKKVLWLGTSIPDLGGHPEIVANRLGFTLKNEALAGSLMRISKSNGSDMDYAPFNTLTFSRTIAEFQAKYPSKPEYQANSYENKLLGNLGQDLYVFDFGFNDYSADISDFTTLPAITSTNRSTFIGAFNYCIFKLLEQEPKARIAIIAHYEDQLKPNIVKAQEALANYWGFPICSLNKKTGWSQIINPASGKTILNDWLPDGVHPHTDTSGKSSALLARILEEFINGI